MSNKEQFLQDRTMKPKSNPNSVGQQQGLKIAVEERNGTCNSVDLSFAVRKDAWVNMSLAAVEYQMLVDAVEDCVRNREMEPITIIEQRKGTEYSRVTVQRDSEGRISILLEGQGNRAEVHFMQLKQYALLKNGQPMSIMEQSERNARGWVRQQHRVLDRLEENFKPFNPNSPGGAGNGFRPRPQQYTQTGGGNGYVPPQAPSAQPATSTQDDFF